MMMVVTMYKGLKYSLIFGIDAIYTSQKNGNDETGDGSESNPFKSILQAMRYAGKEPFPSIYQDSQDSGKKYESVAKSQLKKVQKIWIREQYKNEDKQKKLLEDEEKRLKNLEEAKLIVIKEDTGLPSSIRIKIQDGVNHRDQRVKLFGWVHRLRRQGTTFFVVLRFKLALQISNWSHFGYRQSAYVCYVERWDRFSAMHTYRYVMSNIRCIDAIHRSFCRSIWNYQDRARGKKCIVSRLLSGKVVDISLAAFFQAPNGHELHADYWRLVGASPPGGADTILNEESLPDVQLDNRHIMIRGENVQSLMEQ